MMATMIFETRCAGCDRPGAAICTTCRFALLAPPPHRHTGPAADVLAVLAFTGRARSVVLGLKYRNRRAVSRHLAGLIVNRLIEEGRHASLDVVTWAPTSRRRRRERGFDQGELIARAVARQLGLPVRRLLDRRDEGSGTQTGASRAARLKGPVYAARPQIAGQHVLVVDDVVTTGATLRSARSALAERDAEATLIAVAATPDRRLAPVVPLAAPEPATAA